MAVKSQKYRLDSTTIQGENHFIPLNGSDVMWCDVFDFILLVTDSYKLLDYQDIQCQIAAAKQKIYGFSVELVELTIVTKST